jgi:hypothetical protein
MAIKAAYAKLEHLRHQASGFPSLLPPHPFPIGMADYIIIMQARCMYWLSLSLNCCLVYRE